MQIIPICVFSEGRMMPCCINFSRLPTSACASRHAPCVPCWIAFIIICPAALWLLIIIFNEMTAQTACGKCRLASGRWGRLVGFLYGCTEWHVFGCISNLCGRAWHFSLLQKWHSHFSKVSYSCLSKQNLPWSVLAVLCSTLWTNGLEPSFI